MAKGSDSDRFNFFGVPPNDDGNVQKLLKLIKNFSLDFLYPKLDSLSSAAQKKSEARIARDKAQVQEKIENIGSDTSVLKEFFLYSEDLLAEEDLRKSAVESKLNSFFGQLSIASTLFIGVLLALGTGTIHADSLLFRWMLILGTLYLMLQICLSVKASLSGLAPVPYSSRNHANFVASSSETSEPELKALTVQNFDDFELHRELNNSKFSQLKIAQCAMRNFVVGLVLFALVLILFINFDHQLVALPKVPVNVDATLQPISSEANAWSDLLKLELVGPLMIAGLGLILVLGGFVVMIFSNIKNKATAGVLLILGGIALTYSSTYKLDLINFKIDKIAFKLVDKIEFNKNQISNSSNSVVMNHVLTIGPFPEGKHVMDSNLILECMQTALKPYQDLQTIGWAIIGAVDKRELRKNSAAIYGSNQGLAMSRANWVKSILMINNPKLDFTHALIEIGGATVIGSNVKASQFDADRKVEVFLFGNLKNSFSTSKNTVSTCGS